MVVFACNHCGESIKKQAVEKHYQWKCRNAPVFVSCMDCQKDFKNQEYVQHIKCITELEKYSDKNYLPRAGHNKGERKQQAWTDLVRNVIQSKSSTLQPNIRGILNKLATYDNVPRKQVKFKNFLKNSFGLHHGQDEIIWQLLEAEIQNEKNSNEEKPSSDLNQNGNIHEVQTETESKKSKKRKQENGDVDPNETMTKKKKLVEEELLIEGTKFGWNDSILNVLNKKQNIKLEKLKKKVLGKYLKFSGQTEVTVKAVKKFMKKLKTLGNVEIADDMVMLKNE